MKWKAEKRNINDLHPFDENPRDIGGEQYEQLKESVSKFGLAKPLVINTDNEIIGGHARWRFMKEAGYEEVDVYVPERKLTNEEVEELNIRLNKNIAGDWDFDKLGDFFDEEELVDWGFEESDFDIDMYDDGEDDDEVPETPEEPEAERGDIYQLGDHRLMCGDATQESDVEKLMDGEKADMVFTDPPYQMNMEGSVHADGSKSYNSQHGSIENDDKSDVEAVAFITQYSEIIKKYCTGSWYIFYYRLGLDRLYDGIRGAGLEWRNLIVWSKNNHTLSNSDYMSKYEPILYGWNDNHNWYGGNSEFDIWEVDRTDKNDKHPTMKPVKLGTRAITNSIQRGDIVLDLFGGSGSTLIAAEKTNRKCYMMELDPQYVDVIIERWEDYTGDEAEKI